MELFAHEGGLIRIILKNYTTNKDCLRTIAEIEQTLAGLGARKILPVWRPHCIDERAGFDISDLRTGRVYTQEEAEAAPDTVRARLVLRPRWIGRCVMTREESQECLEKRKRKGDEEWCMKNWFG